MNLHKNAPGSDNDGGGDAPLTPCAPLRTMISRLADGSLTHGPAHWYITHHVDGCAHCADALTALRLLNERLRILGSADFSVAVSSAVVAPNPDDKGTPDALALTADRWEAVLIAWETADAETP